MVRAAAKKATQGKEEPVAKTEVKKTPRKRAVKKTVSKSSQPKGEVKVKVIQTIDSAPGRDSTVIFTDGTRATVKAELSSMLTKPENVAPNMVKVTMQGKNIVAAEPFSVDNPDQ